MGIHDGHRDKMRQRYRAGGLDGFSDHEVLELLLFHVIPRRDTNPLAHRLVAQFGSLAAVLNAVPEELAQVPGMGENAATFLTLLSDVNTRLRLGNGGQEWILTSVETTGAHLMELYAGASVEVSYQLCLDRKGKLIATRRLGEGDFSSTGINVRPLVANALNTGAAAVILAHNHPSGIALPSRDDIYATEQIQLTLETVGVELVDHLIVVEDDFVSMADSGLLLPKK